MEQAQQHLMMGDEHGGKLASFTRSQTNNSSSSNNNNTGSNSSTSNTRWTPTTDQIRILKDLYYTHGVRSPNADQIQRISARLRQYGKIEGKNVFYWFQNHKARERQNKRFNNSNNIINNTGLARIPPASVWKQSESSTPYVHTAAASKNSQHLIYPNGHLISGHNQMTEFGYGSITMEKSIRDCSISAAGSSMGHSCGWAAGGLDHHLPHHPYAYASQYHAVYDQRKSINNDEFHAASDQDFFGDENRGVDIETLRLFPMHGEDRNYSFCHINSSETDGWFHQDVGGASASLELSLNS